MKVYLPRIADKKAGLFVIAYLFWGWQAILPAQSVFTASFDAAGKSPNNNARVSHRQDPVSVRAFILPAGLISYGFIGMGNNPVRDLDISVRDQFTKSHPSFRTHADDYFQYIPALAVYGLNAAGIRGNHRLRDRTLILGMTMLFSSGMVTSLKGLTHKERPDGSSFHSFPSGHTATAFAGAEFLRMEYKDVSPWYGVCGYALAAATGTLRVLNDRHWVSDVVAGAGFGILSARLSCLIFNALERRTEKRKKIRAASRNAYQKLLCNYPVGKFVY